MKILFVEDEKTTSDIYVEYFQDHGFADVDAVARAEEAVEYIQKNRPQLVFLDIGLGEDSEMTGMDVLRAVHQSVPESRIVMLSAYDNYEPEARSLGAYAYIRKPCLPKATLKIAQELNQ
jgi:DNA-binding response OmpR family regulator